MSYARKCVGLRVITCTECDFVFNFEIYYLCVFCIYVEGPKADELSLIGFTINVYDSDSITHLGTCRSKNKKGRPI